MHNKLNFDLAAFCSKDATRHPIDCVNVKSDCTEVTNGHYAIRVSTTNQTTEGFPALDGETVLAEFDSFLLPKEDAKKVSKAIPVSRTLQQIEHAAICKNGDERARIAVTDLDTTTVLQPRKGVGKFPDLDVILNTTGDDKPILTVGFNPEYIAKIAAYAAKFGETLTFTFWDANRIAKLEAGSKEEGGQRMMAMIMPMRLS